MATIERWDGSAWQAVDEAPTGPQGAWRIEQGIHLSTLAPKLFVDTPSTQTMQANDELRVVEDGTTVFRGRTRSGGEIDDQGKRSVEARDEAYRFFEDKVTIDEDIVIGAFDISESTYTNESYTLPNGYWSMDWNGDGTKFYVAANETLYEYDCSTAYDVTTASYNNNSLDVSSEVGQLIDSSWNGDGTKLYGLDNSNGIIYEYDCSTAYDVTSATYNNNSYTSAEVGSPFGFVWNGDGTRFYIFDNSSNAAYQYDCSTAYDVTSATYNGGVFDPSSQVSGGNDITWNNTGSMFYISDPGNDKIWQYECSTEYDITTASYTGKSGDTATGDPHSITWNNDGTRVFTFSREDFNYTIHQYDTGSEGAPDTIQTVLDATLSLSENAGSYSLTFTPSDVTIEPYTCERRTVKQIWRDMMDRGGLVWWVDSVADTITVNSHGGRGAWNTVEAGVDGVRVDKWTQGSIGTVRNDVTVTGTKDDAVSASAEDSTSISTYGRQPEEFNLAYVTTQSEAQAVADALLQPDPLDSGQLLVAESVGDTYANLSNYEITVTSDPQNVTNETVTIEKQIVRESRAELHVGEGIAGGQTGDVNEVNRQTKSAQDETDQGAVPQRFAVGTNTDAEVTYSDYTIPFTSETQLILYPIGADKGYLGHPESGAVSDPVQPWDGMSIRFILPGDGDQTGQVGSSSQAFQEMHAHNFVTASPEPLDGVDAAEIRDADWYENPPECVECAADELSTGENEADDPREDRGHTPVELGTLAQWLLEANKAQQREIDALRERLDGGTD